MTYIGNGPNFMVKAIAEKPVTGRPRFSDTWATAAAVRSCQCSWG